MKKLPLAAAIFLAVSGTAHADFVINDDLIVDGSACIGFDCVNGESFGFDTVRLKEHNLRIHFDDTSTAASFPRNDWRIIVNDSANGGQSKFSIEDSSASRTPFTIEANARSHSLYVDDGGRIGIRTSTPSTEIHVIDGDTPTLRLQQDGSSGFAPQTWDVAGNETNFFIRDVTNGSTLPLRIRPDTPTSTIDMQDGKVGVGTASPADDGSSEMLLEVKHATADVRISIDGGDGSGDFGELLFQENNSDLWGTGYSAGDNRYYVYNYGRTNYDFVVRDSNGYIGLDGVTAPTSPIQHSSGALLTAAGQWQSASSREYKEDVSELSLADAKTALAALEPVTYRYKADRDDLVVGFIAEDVPELVATNSRKTLSSLDIVAVLTKVVQQQQSAIERQNTEMKAQQGVIERLEAKVEALDK